jgi:glucokinase
LSSQSAPARRPVPALEVGGSHVCAALVDLAAGTIVGGRAQRQALGPSWGANHILDTIVACARSLPAAAGARWGAAVPGPFDYEHGVAQFAGVGKFEALRGVDVGRVLAARLPGPPAGITFLNDAEAFLLGEWQFGAARGHRRSVGLTLGTGIGSAFLADGHIVSNGPSVPPEGHAYLLRVSGRPLEDLVSARAIEAAYREHGGSPEDGAGEIARRARRGDEVAARVLSEAFETLGRALRPWLESFAATALVVGGSMTGSWDLIGPALVRGTQAGEGSGGLEVSVATNPDGAGLLGAAFRAEGAFGPGAGRKPAQAHAPGPRLAGP